MSSIQVFTGENRAIKIPRTVAQGTAQSCIGRNFGIACKAWWPHKTAEELAARAGCGVRAASYYIAGEREPSRAAIDAAIHHLLS